MNAHYVAVHAVTGGTKTLRFPAETTLRDLSDGGEELSGSAITLTLSPGETRLFERR